MECIIPVRPAWPGGRDDVYLNSDTVTALHKWRIDFHMFKSILLIQLYRNFHFKYFV